MPLVPQFNSRISIIKTQVLVIWVHRNISTADGVPGTGLWAVHLREDGLNRSTRLGPSNEHRLEEPECLK